MLLQWLKLTLAPPLWRLWTGTVRVETSGPRHDPAAGCAIYACLHRDMIPAILYVRSVRPTLLVSHSPDGDILIRTLEPSGFRFVRGSTGNQGSGAFLKLLGALRRDCSVGVAVDGPKGPFGEIREGVIQLSRLSQRPIIPLIAKPTRCWELHNWDRTVVPRPWSRVRVRESQALVVPAACDDEEIQAWRRRLRDILLRGADGADSTGAADRAERQGRVS